VLRVEEQSSDTGGYPIAQVEMKAMDAAGRNTPIAPGQIRIGSSMSFTFEMVR
jgi:uncharacterized protein YggE